MERVDGERLVCLFAEVEPGPKPKTVYELVAWYFRSVEIQT